MRKDLNLSIDYFIRNSHQYWIQCSKEKKLMNSKLQMWWLPKKLWGMRLFWEEDPAMRSRGPGQPYVFKRTLGISEQDGDGIQYSLREPLNDNGWFSFVFQKSINIPWMSLLKIGPTKAMKSCIRLFIVYQKFTIHTQQHRQYLGTSQKCRVPGSTSDLLNYIYMCVDDTYAH